VKLSKVTIILLVLFGSVGCDQATKVVARQHLDGIGTLSYLGDTFRLTYAENHGAFLGMGSNLPEGVRTLIFTVLVAVFLIGFAVWMFRGPVKSLTAIVASSLIIGGGIGNLIDRIAFDGGVTDFLNIGIGALRTGIFNIADVWIMAGVFALLFAPEMWENDDEVGGSTGDRADDQLEG
jgi:signal peptidase II